jgi:hypothetical protein
MHKKGMLPRTKVINFCGICLVNSLEIENSDINQDHVLILSRFSSLFIVEYHPKLKKLCIFTKISNTTGRRSLK